VCRRRESNPHEPYDPRDFESLADAISPLRRESILRALQ
jgi:hypothetical protein